MIKHKNAKPDGHRTMKSGDFKRWRKAMGFNQKDAADALGLKRRVVQYYEKGERDGKKIDVPKYVRLACYAVTKGVPDYFGPEDEDTKKQKAEKGDKSAKPEAAAEESAQATTKRPRSKKKAATGDAGLSAKSVNGASHPAGDAAALAAAAPAKTRAKGKAGKAAD